MKTLHKHITWAQTFRRARGTLSQAEAAEQLHDCSVRTVQDWENGRRIPPQWVQQLILDRLQRPVEQMQNGSRSRC